MSARYSLSTIRGSRCWFVPSFLTCRWNKDYITTVVPVLATTISTYLFFWQAPPEVAEMRVETGQRALKHAPGQGPA